MTPRSFDHLSDADLIDRTKQAACIERQATVELIALLAELDARRLYLGEGYASLFTYCTEVLLLSESAAYSRITAARTVRRFPDVLPLLAAGDITLTTITLLSAHLTEANHEALLDAAIGKCKRDVERLVASLVPQPDVAATVRRRPSASATLPTAQTVDRPRSIGRDQGDNRTDHTDASSTSPAPTPAPESPCRPVMAQAKRAVLAPLDADRYLLRITLSADTHAKLERARTLCRHVVPDGDLSAILDRALTLLVQDLERTRLAATTRPHSSDSSLKPAEQPAGSRLRPFARTRHVPAATKRAVWARDSGRCAFIGREGRCRETGFLELHHVRPFAAGGPTSEENLELRCRAHNQFEAALYFEQEPRTSAPA